MPASHYQSNKVPDAAQDPYMVEEINGLTFDEAHTDELELRSDRAWQKFDSALLDDHNPQADEVDIGLWNVDVPDLMFDEATPSTSSREFSPRTPLTLLEQVGVFGPSPASDTLSPTDGRKSTPDDHYDDPSPYGLQAEHGSATSSGVYDARFIPERFTPATILARANTISDRRLQPPSPRFAPGPTDAFAQSLCTRPPPARAQFPSDLPSSLLHQHPSLTSRGHTPYAGTRPTQFTTPHIPHQHALPAPEYAGTTFLGYQGNPYGTVTPQLPTNLAASWGDRPLHAQDQRLQISPHYLPPHDVTAHASLPLHRGQVLPNAQMQPTFYATEGYAPSPSPVSQAASSNVQPLPHAIGGVTSGTFALPAHGFAPAPAAAEQCKEVGGPSKGGRAPRKRTVQGLGDPAQSQKKAKRQRIEGFSACAQCQMDNCTEIVDGKKNKWGAHFQKTHAALCSFMTAPTEQQGSKQRWKCCWQECAGKDFSTPAGLGDHVLSKHLGQKFLCPVCGESFSKTFTLTRHLDEEHGIVLLENKEEAGPSM